MRKGGGKSKGASFEREICRHLSLWISNGKEEDVFWRSAMSGGRSTVARSKGKTFTFQAGDISCVSPLGHRFLSLFYVECKSYKNLHYEGLLSGKGTLVQFWEKTKLEAREYFKRPMLIAKQNQQPIAIITNRAGLEQLGLGVFTATTIVAIKLDMYVISLDTFLQQATIDVSSHSRSAPD